MSARPLVLLFDVDGTLVRTGGAGRRAMQRAFDQLHGESERALSVDVRGNTDGRIFAEGLAAIGVDPTPENLTAVLEAYLDALVGEVARSPGFEVLPGVRPLLEAAGRAPDAAVGLGTGNVRRGAQIKLARGNLGRHFPFGGFGCDSHDRPTLLGIGAERGAAHLGRSTTECRVVILGDTPRDVHGARAIGADVIAVATGGHTLEELRAEEPTLLVETLEDPRIFELLGLSASPR